METTIKNPTPVTLFGLKVVTVILCILCILLKITAAGTDAIHNILLYLIHQVRITGIHIADYITSVDTVM